MADDKIKSFAKAYISKKKSKPSLASLQAERDAITKIPKNMRTSEDVSKHLKANKKLLERSKIAEKVSIEVKPKLAKSTPSAGKPSPMKAKSASKPIKAKTSINTPVTQNAASKAAKAEGSISRAVPPKELLGKPPESLKSLPKEMIGTPGKLSADQKLGAKANEILSKGESSRLSKGLSASAAEAPSLSAGGRAMRVAAEEVAGEGEKAALKRIAGKTAGKIGKTFGKLAGAGALGGAVGLGINALVEGLDATEANAGEDAELAALSKAHEGKETKAVEKKEEMKKPKGKSDMRIKKEFAGQLKKHFPESYPSEVKKPVPRAGKKAGYTYQE